LGANDGSEAGSILAMGKPDSVARANALCRLYECFPAIGSDAHMQRRLDTGCAAVAITLSEQSCGNHPAVIENQRVSRPQKIRQIADGMIAQARLTLNDEQARRIARRGWTQRDTVFRQIEI